MSFAMTYLNHFDNKIFCLQIICEQESGHVNLNLEKMTNMK